MLATSKGDLMANSLELQSRALVVACLLSNKTSCGSVKKVENLKRKLNDWRSSLKLSLESNASLNDKVAKFTTDLAASQADIDDLKI